MIPMQYMLALFSTTLLLLYQLVDVTNKYINIVVSGLLSLFTASSWAYVGVLEYNMHLWGDKPTFLSSFIIILISGIVFGFIIMVLSWKEPVKIPGNKDIVQPSYTEKTLFGVTGVIVSKYTDDSYLGKLNDATETRIIVYVEDENVNVNDIFTVSDIEEGKIYAKIIGHT